MRNCAYAFGALLLAGGFGLTITGIVLTLQWVHTGPLYSSAGAVLVASASLISVLVETNEKRPCDRP